MVLLTGPSQLALFPTPMLVFSLEALIFQIMEDFQLVAVNLERSAHHSCDDHTFGLLRTITLLPFSLLVISDSLQPHGLQPTRLLCPSPSPRACSNSCPLSQPSQLPTISLPVVPFSSCLQSSPAPGSFPMSWLFTSGDQNIGAAASTSVLPMNIWTDFL